jgi:cobalt/nickel transport system permease protein
MHIPDGYLSPSTCAVLYAGAAPFWFVALRRLKRVLSSTLVPLVSVFAAFSFIIMMFNLPLPGGTTGHAVGMGIATVVLGPWASMLAVSIALGIQAVFFGDGGITAIGANCFNMAIAGSLTAYGVYRVLAWRAELGSTRRVVAAGLAGYAGINVSALLAAIEFGIQPMLFHDAAGAPLYCPYPLSVSIPAMMIGHLTFAGLAEMFVTAGVVAYLQKAEPALLMRTAPDAKLLVTRKLWWGLAALVILTPVGILAAGTAWGEWSVKQLGAAPRGLAGLAGTWNAPLARYAPSFIPGESFGYVVSAALGVGLVVAVSVALTRRGNFVETTARQLIGKADRAIFAQEIAAADGFLQKLDPRVKLTGLLALIVAAVSVHRMAALAALLALGVALALCSRVRLSVLAARVWLPTVAFSGLIAAPAIFLLPRGQGWWSAAMLLLRVETAATFAMLLILCTEWARVLKALRFFRVPITAVVILGMTYRYLFLLLKTATEMFESRQSRLVGTLREEDRRRLAAGTVGVLLARSFQLSAEVHSAMQARGFQGEVYLLDELRVRGADWGYLAGFVALAAAAVVAGR